MKNLLFFILLLLNLPIYFLQLLYISQHVQNAELGVLLPREDQRFSFDGYFIWKILWFFQVELSLAGYTQRLICSSHRLVKQLHYFLLGNLPIIKLPLFVILAFWLRLWGEDFSLQTNQIAIDLVVKRWTENYFIVYLMDIESHVRKVVLHDVLYFQVDNKNKSLYFVEERLELPFDGIELFFKKIWRHWGNPFSYSWKSFLEL